MRRAKEAREGYIVAEVDASVVRTADSHARSLAHVAKGMHMLEIVNTIFDCADIGRSPA